IFYLQLLLFSGLAFFLMLGWLKRTLTITLDVDWFYRRLGPVAARRLDRFADAAWDSLVNAVDRGVRAIATGVHRLHGPEGHSRPYLAERQHGFLDHDHAGPLLDLVVPVNASGR
ncbi:MAG: hypothetical protein WAL40_17110, partial [Rhodoplanes sp.]